MVKSSHNTKRLDYADTLLKSQMKWLKRKQSNVRYVVEISYLYCEVLFGLTDRILAV